MALPTLDKTWQFDINQSIGYLTSVASTTARLLFAVKDSLVSFGTLPWTVIGSSDANTAGLDAVDRWIDAGDLIWSYNGSGATQRSWIVLEQDGVQTGFQVLIHCYKSSAGATTPENFIEVVTSVAGFTGGSISARPTATDEVIIQDAVTAAGTLGIWGASTTVNIGYKLHVMQSTDGQCTRVIINQDNDGDCTGLFIFDRPKNPVSGWTTPYIAASVGSSSASIATYAALNDLARIYGRGSGTMTMFVTCEGSVGSMIGELLTVVNAFDASWPMSPCGLRSATPSHVGRHAEMFDFWFGSSTRVNGDQYPDTGTLYQFTQFGHLILPWDSATPVVVI